MWGLPLFYFSTYPSHRRLVIFPEYWFFFLAYLTNELRMCIEAFLSLKELYLDIDMHGPDQVTPWLLFSLFPQLPGPSAGRAGSWLSEVREDCHDKNVIGMLLSTHTTLRPTNTPPNVATPPLELIFAWFCRSNRIPYGPYLIKDVAPPPPKTI